MKVRQLDIGWLYADKKDFLEFVRILTQCSNKEIYTSELVKSLLEINWDSSKNSIVKFIIIPYILYLIMTLLYLVYVVIQTPDENATWPLVLGLFLL